MKCNTCLKEIAQASLSEHYEQEHAKLMVDIRKLIDEQ